MLALVVADKVIVRGADNPTTDIPPASLAPTPPHLAWPGPLPQGSIELLAITAHPSVQSYGPSQPWWTADGSPTHQYDLAKSDSFSGRYTTHSNTYELYFLASNVPAGATWTLSGLHGPDVLRPFSISSGEKPVAGSMAFVASAFWDTEFADITVGIAAGEWETIAKVGTDKNGSGSILISSKGIDSQTFRAAGGFMSVGEGIAYGNLLHGAKIWSVSMFAPGFSPNDPPPTGTAKITVVHNVNIGSLNMKPIEWAVRVIAVDQAGQEILPTKTIEDAETAAFVHATYVFDTLTFAQAKEFRFQVRPFQSAEFHHVALKPKPAASSSQP